MDLLVRHTDELELQELHQVVHALDTCLSLADPDDLRYPDVAEAVRQTNPTSTLERLVASELEIDHLSQCLPRDLQSARELAVLYLGPGEAQASPGQTP